MPLLDANVSINVSGWPELRREFANIIAEVAATETDSRVAARLYEVAALVAQTAAEREASELVKRVVPHSVRAENERAQQEAYMSGLGRANAEQKKAADRAHEITNATAGCGGPTPKVPMTTEAAPKQ